MTTITAERECRIESAKKQAQSYWDVFPDDDLPINIAFGDGDVVRVFFDGSAEYLTAEEWEESS